MEVELFRQENSPTKIVIAMKRTPDGGIAISGHDSGEAPRECFGSEEYEYVVSIPTDSVAPLAMALLADKFSGDASAVTRLKEFCEERGITCSFWAYP